MKAIILLEMENGKSSVVISEHDLLKEVAMLNKKLSERPEVRKATILVANLTGRVVTMESHDSPTSIAQIASW